MQSINIQVLEDKTIISYIDNGNKIFSYNSPIGDDYVSKKKYSKSSANDWFSYVLWCMHSISYVDRIPDKIFLSSGSNVMWYSSVLSMQSYAQFFIKTFSNSNKPHVIINSSNILSKDARYQKTISQFKI